MVPGVAHVRVNPGYFADNYLQLIDYAAHLGVFPTITGDGKDAPPSNEDIARVVVAADDHQVIGMASGQPGDDVVSGRGRAVAVHEGVETHLESGDGAVLCEEVVARGSDALVRSGNVGAGLPGAEILQGLRRFENIIRIDVGENGADFGIGRDGAVVGSKADQ